MIQLKGSWKSSVAIAAAFLLASLAAASADTVPGKAGGDSKDQPKSLAERVRHQLIMLPYYGVFDNLSFEIRDADTVVLTGQVTRPTLKTDAERTLHRVEGVTHIVNNVEVLPLSRFDDAIRLATYRAIFTRSGFEKYAIQAISPIRIIVKNGNITLDGVVGSSFDRIIAEMAARAVPGTFAVTNNLTIG